MTAISGFHESFFWFDSPDGALSKLIRDVPDLILGHCVAVLSCDSGPLVLSETDYDRGWTRAGTVALNPPISDPSHIDVCGFDEWYVGTDGLIDSHVRPFINYGGFSIVPPPPVGEIDKTWDRLWAEAARQDVADLQHQFWQQLVRVNPVTYLAEGDRLICATRDPNMVNALLSWLGSSVERESR